MLKNNYENKNAILIVDDVKENLFALNALLERDDLIIHQASSGSEALELMMKHDFCLALLDIQMPEMNGFELAELMRGINQTKNIPIIFVTATANDEKYVFQGYESGAVDFLRKPLDPHAVKSKVNVFVELHQQKKELNQQLIVLNAIKTELEQAVQSREEFMSIAGHELRTPITSLRLQSQLRLRNLKKGNEAAFTKEKLTKMFETDDHQLARLSRLIDDMLDISREDSGKLSMNLESFDLCSVITESIEACSEMFQEAGIIVKTSMCEPINGSWDKHRIEQVITNLLTNGIKYGSGKPIEIKVSAENNQAVIVIQDNGIGIAELDLKRIFQRYERVHGSGVSGLGLGLYVVNQIIEAHNGIIDVKSHVGEGSKFTINLPINA